ncbi:hypothetical protein [Chitinophaga sp. YIM B06452]|uniref:hypothetical protein n=1 Tax=Chitinophaga sp. YIM B06452 TaxID=3082158 RepID=UPI0031FF3176
MAVYTLSIDYIDRVSEPAHKSHLLGVFFQFANPESEHKAAMDDKKVLLKHYQKLAETNEDLFRWLDYMTRNGSSFEIVEVDIPEDASEEEMYLRVASATRHAPAVIVGSHQYWKKYPYLPGYRIICFCGTDVKVLDKDEARLELSNKTTVQNITNINNSPMKKNNNPWPSGSFYLFTAIVLLASLAAVWYFCGFVLPLVVASCLVLSAAIAAFQMRNDERFSEKSFLELMALSFKLAVVRVRDGGKKE